MHLLQRQRGAVLVVSLIILLVLTLIGVSTARTVLLEEKMTFASRDAKVALEVAEALIKKGEAYVDGIATTGNFGTEDWLHVEGSGPTDLLDATTWSNTKSKEQTVEMLDANGNQMTGRIFIELSGNAEKEDPADAITISGYGQSTGGGEIQVFRIVVLGRGLSPTTTRTIISHYGKRL